MNTTNYAANVSSIEYNSTTPNVGYPDNVSTYLSLCQITNAILISATLWIALNFILYLIKHRRRKILPSPNSLDGRRMYAVCLAAVISSLPRLIMAQVMFYIPKIPGALENCEILLDVLNAFHLFAVASTYGFLWYRQRTIYALPMIREITGTVANILSWILILIMLGSYLTLFCVFSIPAIYSWNDEGCTLKANQSENDMKERASRYYIITGVMILWQITLVSLFVYPMVLIRRSQLSIRNRRKNTSIKKGVKKVIIRSVISATVATISDITTVTIASFIPFRYPVFIATSLYDLSLQINIFCIIATFGDNVGLLTVCYYSAETSKSMRRKRRQKLLKMKLMQPNYNKRANV